jgi:hypothetical protein
VTQPQRNVDSARNSAARVERTPLPPSQRRSLRRPSNVTAVTSTSDCFPGERPIPTRRETPLTGGSPEREGGRRFLGVSERISETRLVDQFDAISGRLAALDSGQGNTQRIASDLEAIRADLVKLVERNARLGAELQEALALRSQPSAPADERRQ